MSDHEQCQVTSFGLFRLVDRTSNTGGEARIAGGSRQTAGAADR